MSWNPITAYTHWLHTRWPAGTVEKLPQTNDDGSTNVPGVYVVGDLTGIPLLKFSADTGARAVATILADPAFQKARGDGKSGGANGGDGVLDLVIVGGGVSGFAAALEAEKAGLSYTLLESAEPFSTLVNFPKAKPIYTYPTEMTPAGDMRFKADVKEALIDEVRAQTVDRGMAVREARAERVTRASGGLLEVQLAEGEPLIARRVIIAIGRSGNFRRLGVPGEELDKVSNRLHDPHAFEGQQVLVVGGGDSALETAIALAEAGAAVTLSYRKAEFSRPKPDNIERLEALKAADGGDDVAAGQVRLQMPSQVAAITADAVELSLGDGKAKGGDGAGKTTVPNDAVFAMLGREAPLDFFRRSGISIAGEWRAKTWIGFIAFFTFSILLYHWKSFSPVKTWFANNNWFPNNMPTLVTDAITAALNPANPIGTLALSLKDPSFYYSLAYSLCIILFGIDRIRRRKTPYVTRQTLTLMAIQVIPLFLLPFLILPWLGHLGAFGTRKQVHIVPHEQLVEVRAAANTLAAVQDAAPEGAEPDAAALAAANARLADAIRPSFGDWQQPTIKNRRHDAGEYFLYDAALANEDQWKREATLETSHGFLHVMDWDKRDSWLATQLFPIVTYEPQGREYWRASGFILAWPLFVWNVFTGEPNWVWLSIALLQTFVIIPFIVWRWGKGAYCGWICSCGALAETMGDRHRQKMPHGPFWNRLNMIGQVFLAAALGLLVLRIVGWIWPKGPVGAIFQQLFYSLPGFNYAYIVDLWWAGIIGVGAYFHFSGRVWCRFACPLAALMHIYARFSQFRIIPEKKKCISCNVCTTVCHQGIDVMSFANKGEPMADPECVRCSACVQSCPTGVLTFGRIDPKTGEILSFDLLEASPVKMKEKAAEGSL